MMGSMSQSSGTEDAPVERTSPYLSEQRYGTPDARYRGLSQGPYSPWAIASLVLGLCATAIFAVITGHVALSQIKRTGQRGAGLAIAGLVLGYLEIVFYVLVVIGALGLLAWIRTQS